MAGRGGKRLGAGRKKSALTIRTQDIAAAVTSEGISPLEVMVENMRWWYQSSERITEKLREAVDFLTPQQMIEGGKQVQEIIKLLNKLSAFREKAEACAVDAAPYIHPKLASVEFKGDKDNPILHEVNLGMTAKEAADLYQATLRGE